VCSTRPQRMPSPSAVRSACEDAARALAACTDESCTATMHVRLATCIGQQARPATTYPARTLRTPTSTLRNSRLASLGN